MESHWSGAVMDHSFADEHILNVVYIESFARYYEYDDGDRVGGMKELYGKCRDGIICRKFTLT